MYSYIIKKKSLIIYKHGTFPSIEYSYSYYEFIIYYKDFD